MSVVSFSCVAKAVPVCFWLSNVRSVFFINVVFILDLYS